MNLILCLYNFIIGVYCKGDTPYMSNRYGYSEYMESFCSSMISLSDKGSINTNHLSFIFFNANDSVYDFAPTEGKEDPTIKCIDKLLKCVFNTNADSTTFESLYFGPMGIGTWYSDDDIELPEWCTKEQKSQIMLTDTTHTITIFK